MKDFNKRLKKLRTDSNITQDALAEYLGISYQAVSKWENALGYPDISLIPAISNFFGVSSDYLLGIDLENSEGKIEKILSDARKFTHTGEIKKSICIIEDALKNFPNEHRLLCDLIEYKVMIWQHDDGKWLEEIESKANLILRDCNIDKIRHKTIVNLAFAYSYCDKKEKVLEIAQLLPEVAYSKKQLLSLAAPIKERVKYKSDCILSEAEILLCDVLTVSKHHIFWGDPSIAIDVCNRALKIIDGLGTEGYLLYMQESAYEDLILAYGKMQLKDEMYFAMEKALDVCKQIEKILSDGGQSYSSPLLTGLKFSKDTLTFNDDWNSFKRYHNLLIKSKTLKPYKNEERFMRFIDNLKKLI